MVGWPKSELILGPHGGSEKSWGVLLTASIIPSRLYDVALLNPQLGAPIPVPGHTTSLSAHAAAALCRGKDE